jgi:ComF family protein
MSPASLSNLSAAKFDSEFDRSKFGDTAAGNPLSVANAAGPGGRPLPRWRVFARFCRRALPQQCALCAVPCGSLLVCRACSEQLPRIARACPRCALPSASALVCGACLARPPPFVAAFAAFAYAFPLDRLLHAFKYGGRLAHADFFAASLADCVADSVVQRLDGLWPDALVALPLAPTRQRERGFDQAAEIARRVAHLTGIPKVQGLHRTRDTPAQAALPWKDRAANVRGAFAADPSLAGLRIAIVDDVMTTGATLSAAAGAVLRAGARAVEVWAVARTLPPA